MTELALLKSLWTQTKNSKQKIKRRKELIVPSVTYNQVDGSLNNEHWYYIVPYAFRDALDLKLTKVSQKKSSSFEWTQGPIISFKNGDFLQSKNGLYAVQVQFSNPMGWDTLKQEMYYGNVNYILFSCVGNKFIELDKKQCNQLDFLQLLIYGNNELIND